MRVDAEQYVRKMHANRKLRHRIAAFLTAMSMVVSMAVFWQLRGVGTAMDNTQTCGLQEHTHTDECYEKVLICEDSEHEHTEECYEKRLVCGLDEHEHSSGCVSDEAADVETQAVWEKTLPEKLTDDVRENIALVAVSQLGYSESRKNYHISDDGETKNGYTRYGQWYGSPYGEWNSLFTYFCMYYAGVDRQSVPYGSGIAAWAAELEKKELLLSAKDAKLQKGDVLLIDADLDKKPDKAAVVVEMTEKDGKVLLETVQGDVDGEVAKVSIEQADEHIAGYVSLETAAAEMLFEQESASGIKVTAKAEKGAFPEKTTMTVTDIDKAEAEKTARQAIGANEKVLDAVAVDITFKDKDGRETEPAENKKVQVQITLPESKKFDEGEYSLLHVRDEGSVEKITDASVTAAGAEFETESFSIFILTRDGEYVEPSQLVMLDGEIGNNSEDNPYVINIGETIRLRYMGEYLNNGRFTVQGNDYGDNLHYIVRTPDGYDTIPQGENYKQAAFIGSTAGKCRIVYLDNNNQVVHDLWVQVKQSPIYISTIQGELPSNSETYNLLNGYGGPPWWPYHYYLGDTITVTAYADPSASTNAFTLTMNESGALTPISENVAGTRNGLPTVTSVYRVDKVVDSSISPRIHFGDEWLIIHTIYPVYVHSNLGDKNIDLVNEWLSGMNLPKQNGYIPNSAEHPYVMHADDTITLYGYDTAAGVNFSFEPVETTDTVIEQVGSQSNVPADGKYKTTVTYKAVTAGLAKVDFGNNRTVYIRVFDNATEQQYTHADIEISDGGKYSHTTVEYQGAKKVTTVRVYNSYITAVNRCVLYDKDGKVIVPTKTTGDPTDGDDISFIPDDYYQNGQPGQPQYELTSQYKIVNGRHIDSIKRYKGSDVQTALFDVKLTLKPSYQFTITEENGVKTTSADTPLTGGDVVIDNALFNMDHQDVIDASNKCPNHSGLDFTIRATMALTEVEAIKSLKGGNLNGDDFEFEIVDGSGTTIATALNAQNGTIKFDNLHFDAVGEFTYQMKEVIPQSSDTIEYDPREYTLHFTVKDLGNGVMSAELQVTQNETYEFENKTKYHLPDTGGGGIIPHISVGAAMMAGSVLLLWRKKRREAE